MKTKRTSALPPFHTHVIGSMPRPLVIRELLSKQRDMPSDRFKAQLDEMILFVIRLQEQAGIDIISDGEWRRIHYIVELFWRIGGFEQVREIEHQGGRRTSYVAVRQMDTRDPVFADDARFLVAHTDRCTKFALPSPFLIAIRFWHKEYSADAYPTPYHLMDRMAEILALEAQALVAAGIDVIQVDDPAITYFCDRRLTSGEDIHDERTRRDWDIETELPKAVDAVNRVIDGLDAEVHVHCCHSVYKRQSDVVGDYKPILPHLGDLKADRINLEFAYQGTGDASDLDLLPDHMDVGMGVLDVRREEMQSVDEIEALGDAGAARIAPERIALNPDCGFAPAADEPPSIDEAYEKLCRLTEASKRLQAKYVS